MISNNLLAELFKHYSEEEKKQLQQQINVIINYITENADVYSKSKDFSNGVDGIFKLVLAGEFIQRKDIKENTNETL